ncbi:MAG: TonB-dependent receptor [Bacteroidota bacterium]
MKKTLVVLVLASYVVNGWAQFSISGNVKNANGEPLVQATVFLVSTYHAAVTDEKGDFLIEDIEEGYYTLKASYVGYKSYVEEIDLERDMKRTINLGESLLSLEGVEINTTRLKEDAAFAFTELEQEDFEDENLGQDVPFLLRWTPSAVVTSDAGTGIGYTGIRIRGTDPTRINVTINGVPLNDAESHNVFWVDLPDFMTSVDNVQIQRGAGSSTNGPAAFGGTISMNTNKLYQNPYIHANSTLGSFNTRKLSVSLGTGLLNDKYSIDGRYSVIKSDGYVDRASADLNSWYFTAARLTEQSSLRLIAFSGNERTYQSWYGSPESRVNGDEDEILAHYNRNVGALYLTPEDSTNLFESDRRYNYYTYINQVDDYQQDHYQLHYSLFPSSIFQFKLSAFYTRGLGFFEEYQIDESFGIYSLPEVTDEDGNLIEAGDLIRRRWLDNDFYGALLNWELDINPNFNLQYGGAVSRYQGDHYGLVVAAEGILNVNQANRYYEGVGDKTDANIYLKANYKWGNLNVFADVQRRELDYTISGEDDDLTPLDESLDFSFFNPKFGLTYFIDDRINLYASYAVANKEPTRGDIIANLSNIPQHETLRDIEFGYRMNHNRFMFEWNNYIMLYENQLVLRGDVNNSGAFIRENVGESSRLGMEFIFGTQLSDRWFWNINATLSRNKVDEYIENLGEVEDGQVVNTFENTDISFSPSIIGANTLMYKLNDEFEFELSTKYVGKQFLDNTSNDARSLPAFTYSNLRVGYTWDPTFLGRVKLNAILYNLLDAKYSTNGYTYSYALSRTNIVTENFLYPQAGIHFMLGVNVEF